MKALDDHIPRILAKHPGASREKLFQLADFAWFNDAKLLHEFEQAVNKAALADPSLPPAFHADRLIRAAIGRVRRQ